MLVYTFCIHAVYIEHYIIIFHMPVVSVRIDERIKQILEEAGINIGQEVKRFLSELAWKVEVKKRIERFGKVIDEVPPAEKGFSAKSVREDREDY